MVTALFAALAPAYAPVLERIVAALLEQPPDALFEAGKKAQLGVAAAYDGRGVRSLEAVAFDAKWADGAAFAAALRQGALEAVELALSVLEPIDRQKTVDEAVALLVLPRPTWVLPAPSSPDYRRAVNEEGRSFSRVLRERIHNLLSRNADLAPPAALLELDQARGLLLSLARGPLEQNAALADASQLAPTTARALQARPGSDFSRYLLRRLTQRDPAAARAIVEPLFARLPPSDGEWPALANALDGLGSTAPRDVLVAAVRDGRITQEATFPKTLLDDASWAVFEADPKGAYDVLAPYLDQASPSHSGHSLSMTDAVVNVLTLDHEGKPSPSGRGGVSRGFYASEPRWAALFAKKAARELLWERVLWLFVAPLPQAEAAARLAKWERRRRAAEKKRGKGPS